MSGETARTVNGKHGRHALGSFHGTVGHIGNEVHL